MVLPFAAKPSVGSYSGPASFPCLTIEPSDGLLVTLLLANPGMVSAGPINPRSAARLSRFCSVSRAMPNGERCFGLNAPSGAIRGHCRLSNLIR